MILELINKHQRDNNIQFIEEGHKYLVLNDVNNEYTSVTTFIHSQFEIFDADKIINKMMKGRNWNKNNKYFNMSVDEIKQQWDNVGFNAASIGTLLHRGIELFMNQPFVVYEQYLRSDDKTIARCSQQHLLNYYSSKSNCICSYEINDEYVYNNKNAIHNVINSASTNDYNLINITDIINTNIILQESKTYNTFNQNDVMTEWHMFLNFIKKYPNFKPYRTEWVIYDETLKISGSVDMVYKNDDGTFDIYDWKRSKEIEKISKFGKYATTGCIDYIPDTNYWKYTLQLNLYKRILEDNYNISINKLKLVVLHPNNNNYMIIDVKTLTETINDLYSYRLSTL
jgi:hypothetical protein